MSRAAIIGGVVGVSVLLAAAVASASSSTQTPQAVPVPGSALDIVFPVFAGKDGAALIQDLAQATGLHQHWQYFLLALAAGETQGTYTSNVVLGDPALYPLGSKASPSTKKHGPNEAAAARAAFAAGAPALGLRECPWPESAWVWGSGGWWSQIPVYAFAAYRNTPLACRHPWYLLHPVDQFVCALAFASRLMQRDAFAGQPNWLSLRVGWGTPSMIGDPTRRASVRQRFGDRLETLDIPRAFLDSPVPPLPQQDIYTRWGELMRQFDFEPGLI